MYVRFDAEELRLVVASCDKCLLMPVFLLRYVTVRFYS